MNHLIRRRLRLPWAGAAAGGGSGARRALPLTLSASLSSSASAFVSSPPLHEVLSRVSGTTLRTEEADAFVRVVGAQGYECVAPRASAGVHPLVVPVARLRPRSSEMTLVDDGSGGGDDDVLGLYYDPIPVEDAGQPQRPQPGQDPLQASPRARSLLPVVRYRRGGASAADSIELVAASMRQYVHLALVNEAMMEADVADGCTDTDAATSRSVASAAGDVGLSMCTSSGGPASVADVVAELRSIVGLRRSSLLKADMYVLQKVGKLPDLLERLAWQHMAKSKALDSSMRGSAEDTGATSALVTADLYMRNSSVGWARPYVFAAEQLMMLGRREEARDMCRVALRQPWYTLGSVDEGSDVAADDTFAWVAEVAEYTSDPDVLFDRLRDEDAKAKDPKCTGAGIASPLELAMHLLNRTSVLKRAQSGSDACIYAGIRGQLAGLFTDSGYGELGAFIATTET